MRKYLLFGVIPMVPSKCGNLVPKVGSPTASLLLRITVGLLILPNKVLYAATNRKLDLKLPLVIKDHV